MTTKPKTVTNPAAPVEPKVNQYRIDINTEKDKDPTYIVNAVDSRQAVIKAVDRFAKDYPKQQVTSIEVGDNSARDAFVYIP